MWRAWLGFNICLLIATHDFQLVEHIDIIRTLTLALATGCFTVATMLLA
jgi:hypothetical protein